MNNFSSKVSKSRTSGWAKSPAAKPSNLSESSIYIDPEGTKFRLLSKQLGRGRGKLFASLMMSPSSNLEIE
jgi:hypothetical protein